MSLTKSQAIALINSLYATIPTIHVSWSTLAENLFHAEKETEKLHRKSFDHRSVKGFSVDCAARYFTVKHLHEGATASYTIEDMIDTRREALLGCAYARRYAEELKEWMEIVRVSGFDEIDYAELMK